MTIRTLRWPLALVALLLAGLLAAALLASVAVSPPVAHAVDRKDCSDFNTQKQAQRWFRHHHPRRDPSHLDNDNDRIACESNPCPCSRRWHRQHGKVSAKEADIRINAGTHQAVKPHRLLSLSGDGAFYMTKIRHWRHWNHRRAKAHGKVHLNNCQPDCADGTFSTYRGRVRVSRPLNCGEGHKSYSKVRVRFHGQTQKEHWPRSFACSNY
jgi:Excalibur calcium-binding domain